MTESLIERLVAATEGGRELDLAIHRFVVASKSAPGLEQFKSAFPNPDELSHFSTSIDAAIPGENIEAVALHDVVEGEPLGTVWEAWHVDPETRKRTMGAGYTEPIARRVAALKALHDG